MENSLSTTKVPTQAGGNRYSYDGSFWVNLLDQADGSSLWHPAVLYGGVLMSSIKAKFIAAVCIIEYFVSCNKHLQSAQ